jgi:large subunit ribosomal protein L15
VNVGDLERIDGATEVDPQVLRENGLIRSLSQPVKVLARGDVDRPLTIRAHAFSAAARTKIEAAGGSAQLIE